MRIGVIGDLHGSNIWKEFIKDTSIQKWIFLGDFVDSFDYDDKTILHNLIDLIQFQKLNPNNVVLLLGNHDLHYYDLRGAWRAGGFRETMMAQLNFLYQDGIKNHIFKFFHFEQPNYLFTHAGVSRSWLKSVKLLDTTAKIIDWNAHITDILDKILKCRYRDTYYRIGTARNGWGSGGPLWADKTETHFNLPPNIFQVVGHTKVSDITYHPKYDRNDITESIIYIDCLEKQSKYLILEI